MTTTKTIRVKRAAKYNESTCRFDAKDCGLTVYSSAPELSDADELDITITPVKSLKQQRREARGKLIRELPLINRDNEEPVLKAIERADAEFDREREAERREKWHVALEDFWRLRLRAYEDGTASKMELAYESAREAIEAIYRGER